MSEQALLRDFPLLNHQVNDIAYLDNGATTQKPESVIQAICGYYGGCNANPHRGAYALSVKATDIYENARAKTAKFIHAQRPEEIIFTKNATEALNLVAYSYGLAQVEQGDEIVLTISEHHSNLVPWQFVARTKGAILKYIYLEEDGKRTELQTGDTLFVGDKLVARYELWSAENRSFVRVDAFREACFLPEDQLSGPARGSFGPIRVDGLWTRFPQCYRDIRADRTCWWLDVCPEESSTWEETFFVTQAGTFTTPVMTVESLYAPQYRANAAYRAPLSTVYP